jgi:hypothetical protein
MFSRCEICYLSLHIMHCLGPFFIFPYLVNGSVYKILFKFILLFERFIAIIYKLFSMNRNFIIIICLILKIVNIYIYIYIYIYIVVDKDLLNNRLIQLQMQIPLT